MRASWSVRIGHQPLLLFSRTTCQCIQIRDDVRSETMPQQNITVRELIDYHNRGILQLPAIQRSYVWRAPRVRDLLDSHRGYPSGAILVWQSDQAVAVRDFAVSQEESALQGRLLLLDGQQRITSLAAVLTGNP